MCIRPGPWAGSSLIFACLSSSVFQELVAMHAQDSFIIFLSWVVFQRHIRIMKIPPYYNQNDIFAIFTLY